MKMQRKALQRVPAPKYYEIGNFQVDLNRRTGTLLAIAFECEPTNKRDINQGIQGFVITFSRDELNQLITALRRIEPKA